MPAACSPRSLMRRLRCAAHLSSHSESPLRCHLGSNPNSTAFKKRRQSAAASHLGLKDCLARARAAPLAESIREHRPNRTQRVLPPIPTHYLDSVVYLYPSQEAAETGEGTGGSGFLAGVPIGWEGGPMNTHFSV